MKQILQGTKAGKGKRVIIVHAMTKDGLLVKCDKFSYIKPEKQF